MKYIVLPILKIVWAIILTVICTGMYVFSLIALIIHLIWNFGYDKYFLKYIIEYEFYYIQGYSFILSPYFTSAEDHTRYKFKTLYHYVWNIDYQIIKE